MRKSRFTEEQIAMALRQAEAGTAVREICRKLEVMEQTFYRWKRKYGGLGVQELRELKQLREENRRLKGLVADLSLDREILQEAVGKNGKPSAAQAGGIVGKAGLSSLRASGESGARDIAVYATVSEHEQWERATQTADPRDRLGQGELRIPASAHAASPRRLAGELQAGLPALPGGRTPASAQTPEASQERRAEAAGPMPKKANERWAMDFMHDTLSGGCTLRVLTVLDVHTRECVALKVGRSFKGEDVAGTLSEVGVARAALPEVISVDNGTEFTSRSLDHWAYWNRVRLDFSRPGKPTDNAHIEAFNSVFRRECLSQHWFIDLEDAQRVLDHWRVDYNNFRTHGSLARSTPADFAAGAPFTLGLRSSKTRISSGPVLGASAIPETLTYQLDRSMGGRSAD